MFPHRKQSYTEFQFSGHVFQQAAVSWGQQWQLPWCQVWLFITTECPLKLGMENTADACQGGWWDAGWELWLLMGWGRHGLLAYSWLWLCQCHAMPCLCSWSSAIYTPLFILLLPPGVLVWASFGAVVHHTQRTRKMLMGFRSEQWPESSWLSRHLALAVPLNVPCGWLCLGILVTA